MAVVRLPAMPNGPHESDARENECHRPLAVRFGWRFDIWHVPFSGARVVLIDNRSLRCCLNYWNSQSPLARRFVGARRDGNGQ